MAEYLTAADSTRDDLMEFEAIDDGQKPGNTTASTQLVTNLNKASTKFLLVFDELGAEFASVRSVGCRACRFSTRWSQNYNKCSLQSSLQMLATRARTRARYRAVNNARYGAPRMLATELLLVLATELQRSPTAADASCFRIAVRSNLKALHFLWG